ncbi:hypothetical protein [Novosphingobium sp. 9]|uniref:hypothetical protein n=1 Tax=Novosphingobium sp. 9 TaxID=2025349 RepID=UPI0021B5F510|nr:hypothetical protein [Novosphingobium sp. 9]
MIPWFIVNLVGAIAWFFGYEVYVSATGNSWQWGADRIHFIERDPNARRPQRLAPYKGDRMLNADWTHGTESHAIEASDLGGARIRSSNDEIS